MSVLSIPARQWMKGPLVDLCIYAFGWLLILLPLMVYRDDIYAALYYARSFSELAAHPKIILPALLILLVFMVNYVHRHLTLVLVYGDRETFNSRRSTYIATPVFLFFLTAGFVHFDLFVLLLTISVIWTMYHSVAQKYGFTRIYSRKAGYGEAWIDRGLIFSWFAWLVFAMAARERDTLDNFSAGQTVVACLGDYLDLVPLLSRLMLVIALGFTLVYVINEYRSRRRFSWPKNAYVASIMLLYTVFLYDMVIGYIVFAFSHGSEYITFVNLYVKNKYRGMASPRTLLARASARLWLYSGLFSLLVVALSLAGMYYERSAFLTYIIGSSFLHFLYDGWLWKVRKPVVGKPLDIHYV